MRARLPSAFLSLLVCAGAFALGGCDDEEDDLVEVGTLILDDDRTTGGVITVYVQLGSETPTTVQISPGGSKILSLVQGTYTVTFDDDSVAGTAAPSSDTKESSVRVETDKTTTVEYAGEDDSDVIGPVPVANG